MQGLTLKDVAFKVVHESKYSIRQQAEYLGTSYSMLCNAVSPDRPDFKLAARHVVPLTLFNSDFRILDFFEASCRRVAFSLPELPSHVGELQHLVADNVKEFGDVLTCISKALEDGKISQFELKKFEVEVFEQVRTAMALLKAAQKVCEKGGA